MTARLGSNRLCSDNPGRWEEVPKVRALDEAGEEAGPAFELFLREAARLSGGWAALLRGA